MNDTTQRIHHSRIERDRQRAIQFLGAVGRSPRIFQALRKQAGYTQQTHHEGWQLLVRSLGHVDMDVPETVQDSHEEAINALNAWDGPNFSRAQAALRVRFPKHNEFLFKGLAQGDGVRSVGVVQAFLDRVNLLREQPGHVSPVKGSTLEEDREVLYLLESRKVVDAETEAQLRQWLVLAQQTDSSGEPIKVDDAQDQRFDEAVRDLNAWLIDWRGQARAIIKRRDDQIRLGLAKRRSAKAANDNAEEQEDNDFDEETREIAVGEES